MQPSLDTVTKLVHVVLVIVNAIEEHANVSTLVLHPLSPADELCFVTNGKKRQYDE